MAVFPPASASKTSHLFPPRAGFLARKCESTSFWLAWLARQGCRI